MNLMRILQICHKPPRPSLDGGCRAMDALTRGMLDAGHKVKVITASTEKHPWKPDSIEADWLEKTQAEAVFLDTRLNKVDAFASLVTGDSYNISRFYSPDFENKLIKVLQSQVFDLVLFESLFTAPYLPTVRRFCDGAAVLRAHNVEHQIWQHLAEETPQLTKRMYLKWLASKLAEYEVNVLQDFDAIAAISAEDIARFKSLGCSLPMHLLPFGLDDNEWPKPNDRSVNHVFHLGAMDWRPNQQGVRWFTNRVWPLVRQRIPQAELRLAGRHFPSNWSVQESMGIEILGEVKNAWELMTGSGIMIIPLLSGSGMRIKAIEAMAAGRPIVSTPIGIEGLAGEDGNHFHVASTPEAFAKHIIQLLENPDEAQAMGSRGRAWANTHFRNKPLIESMLNELQVAFEL